mmetsp:Transcript_35584/g.34621  ORF Transcript_35584/g.34621 Transcript_35584/m.34621 type:complete len:142 (+) Transcript_35584:1142-1567(+)
MTQDFHNPILLHFTPNASPVSRDVHGNYKIFSGDFLDTPTSQVLIGKSVFGSIRDWVLEVIERAEIPEDSPIELYFDLGHFFPYIGIYPWQRDEAYLDLGEFVGFIESEFRHLPSFKFIPTHIKDTEGFNLALYNGIYQTS